MTDRFVTEEVVGEDGKLVLQLPPDAPHGHIRITVEAVPSGNTLELTPEEEAAPDAEIENLRGLGQTAEEIANAPEIGIWKDRTDMADSVAFIETMRRESLRKRLSRD